MFIAHKLYTMKVKVVIRTDHVNKDGTQQIQLSIVLNNQSRRYGLPITCKKSNWNKNARLVKKTDQLSNEKNLLIKKELLKAESIVLKAMIQDIELNHDYFYREYRGNGGMLFEHIVYDEIENKSFAYQYNTLRKYKSELNKLLKFSPEVKLKNFTNSFMDRYVKYLFECGNSSHTILKSIKFIKKFLNLATQQNLIPKNPIDTYSIKTPAVRKVILNTNEIIKISQIPKESDLFNHAIAFLFACLTGLRYSDVKNLTSDNITNDFIIVVMEKTKKEVFIPLLSETKHLLSLLEIIPNQKIFNIGSNQYTNRQLKEIAKFCDIDKHITFHTARHTFATILINKEVPLKIIQTIMGHSRIEITEQYAQLANITIKKKFEGFKMLSD